MTWLEIARAVAVAGICAFSCGYYLHMMQLESYQTDGYLRWLNKHRDRQFGWTLNIGVLCTIMAFVLGQVFMALFGRANGNAINIYVMLAIFAISAWILRQHQYKSGKKRPLVMTARMKRLWFSVCIVAMGGSWLFESLRVPGYLLFAGVPYIVLIAAYMIQPIEKQINLRYFNQARAILEGRDDLIRIGITGSFGKTSTKVILATILSGQFDVLASPSSFNTPMGLTRVIREQLKPNHQVFIAEMGARHKGDIQELCTLVRPQYGLLTSVGEQHMETFLNIETVASTKFELIEGLEPGGAGFFSADDGRVDELFKRATCEKYRVGIAKGFLSMYAEGIEVGVYGSRFTLCDSDGERVRCETKLLGRHNIENIVLASAMAKKLNMSMQQIARGISRIEPVEHRLQLIPGANNMIIIDDAFNSNPVGAAAALDVLGAFPDRRVIVTPGMVEQGEKEAELNRQFGAQMKGKADIAILVGEKHTAPIREGLLSVDFEPSNIHTVRNLTEATELLARIGRPRDVVLFENDLTDNYTE